MNDSKELQATGEGRVLNYSDSRVIETIRQTVAVGATDSELAMFLEFAKSTGLNPFKKEIWFIKAGGRPQIMTGINGFHALANSHPQYDGIEGGLISPEGECVSAAYPKGDFIGAWCRVHRKDRKVPTEGIAMLAEYDKGQGNWSRMKRVMINKCAESVALRKAFPQELGGLYTAEEMPTEFAQPAIPAAVADKVKPADAWTPTTKVMSATNEYWYDLAKIADDKREAALEYAESEGAALEPETGLYISKVPLKKLHKAQVQAPRKAEVDATDDIPESWKTAPQGAA